MPRLDRYVLSQLLAPFGIALAASVGLGLTSQLIRLVSRPESLALSPLSILQLSLCIVPALSTSLVPAALLAATLATLGRLGSDGELSALEAAGISPWRLLRPLLGLALLCSLATAVAATFGEPWGRRQMRTLLADLQGDALSRALPPGVVQPLLPGLTLFRAPPPAQSYMLADDRTTNRYVVFARTGRLEYDPANGQLEARFQDGEMLRPAADGSYQRLRFQTYRLELPLPPLLGRFDPAELYSDELRARITRLELEGRTAGGERLALARRHAYPAACLSFVLVALPLGSYRGRTPRARGYLLASALLLFYYLLLRAADAYAMDGPLPPPLAVWMPNLLLAAGGLLALWRRARRC